MAPPRPKANPASLYTRTLQMARQNGFAIGKEAYERLLRTFGQALNDIVRDEESGRITPERAAALREQLTNTLDALRARTSHIVGTSMDATVDEVVRLHQMANVSIAQAAGVVGLGYSFDRVPMRVMAVLASRDQNAATFKTLINRRFNLAIEQVDVLINSAVTRGVAAGQLTRDLAHAIGDNSLFGHLPSASRLHRGELGAIDLEKYGVAPENVKQVRTLLYDMRRIAVTEQNNALREANTQSLVASPIVAGAGWQLSGWHPHVDECDGLAQGDFYGLGPGVYPVELWPAAPHPFCRCTQGYPVKMRPPGEWGKPRGNPPSMVGEPQYGAGAEIPDKVRERTLAHVQGTAEVRRAAEAKRGAARTPVSEATAAAPAGSAATNPAGVGELSAHTTARLERLQGIMNAEFAGGDLKHGVDVFEIFGSGAAKDTPRDLDVMVQVKGELSRAQKTWNDTQFFKQNQHLIGEKLPDMDVIFVNESDAGWAELMRRTTREKYGVGTLLVDPLTLRPIGRR